MTPVRVQLSVNTLGRPFRDLYEFPSRIIDHVWDLTHWAQEEELVSLVELQVEDRLPTGLSSR